MPRRYGQHTEGSALLASSFGALCEVHSLAVPGHNPFPHSLLSSHLPAPTHPCSGWWLSVVPTALGVAAGSSRQQEGVRHVWALSFHAAGTHTLSGSAGAWQLHGYV